MDSLFTLVDVYENNLMSLTFLQNKKIIIRDCHDSRISLKIRSGEKIQNTIGIQLRMKNIFWQLFI